MVSRRLGDGSPAPTAGAGGPLGHPSLGNLSAASEWPLVGRARELALVGSALADPDLSGVVIAGPPGVGKTRLLEECARLAVRSGFGVVRVFATRAAGAIPFGALAPVLPPRPPELGEGADTLRWTADMLVQSAGGRPPLVIVDDAHLVDLASATVLQQLATGRRAFVAVSVRPGMAPDPIMSLWKDGFAERIDLVELTVDEVDRLLGVALGGHASGAAANELWQLSAGNALFLRELIVGGVQSGRLVEESGVWHIGGTLTASVRLTELIRSRMGALTASDVEVAELVAFGEPVGAGLIESRTSPDAVEAVERVGVIAASRSGRREELRMRHPLYGDVLRDGMSASQVRRMCARLADGVEWLGARRRDDVIRVASWRLHDAGRHDATLMLTAARQARAAPDLDAAERLAVAAREAGGGWEAAFLVADVVAERGRHDEAERLFSEAAAEARSEEEHAIVAMGRSTNLFGGFGRVDEAIALDTETLSVLRDEQWRDEVEAHRATFELLRGRPAVALASVRRLLAIGRGRPFVEAAIVAAPALVATGSCIEASRLTESAYVAHCELADQREMAHPAIHLVSRVHALREAGRLVEAESLAELGYNGSIAARSTLGQAYFALQLAMVWLDEGRVQSAFELCVEADSLFADLHLAGRCRWCWSAACLAAALVGDVDSSDRLLGYLDTETGSFEQLMYPEEFRARAWNAAAHGELTRARQLAARGARQAETQGEATPRLGLLHDLARLGDHGVTPEVESAALSVEGDFAALRRLHVNALGRRDGDDLDDAAEGFARMGAFLLAAEAAADAGRAHERARAGRLAAASRRRSEQWVARCEGARTPALADSGELDRLTAREREVAALAASGLANRAIAERLFVSMRTVENHLQRVYDKLGVDGREDLAALFRDS